MRVRTPAGAFASVKARIQLAMSGEAMDRVKKAMALAAVKEVGIGFRQETNPYGEAWAPLKHRKGQILSDTGRLRRSFSYTVTSSGFRIGSAVKYAKYHQDGTRGRSKSGSRFQPVDSSGRFLSRRKAGKGRKGAVGVRALNFSAGSGGIPARHMVPTKARGLGPIWTKLLKQAAAKALRNALKKKRR